MKKEKYLVIYDKFGQWHFYKWSKILDLQLEYGRFPEWVGAITIKEWKQ